MRRFLLAAILLGAACGAQAADMPFPSRLLHRRVEHHESHLAGLLCRRAGRLGIDRIRVCQPPPTARCRRPSFRRSALPTTGSRWGGRTASMARYGAFAGYNSQWDDVVVGLEANYIHGGFRAVSSSTGQYRIIPIRPSHRRPIRHAVIKVSDFGSLRVRAGYVMGCFLPYAYLGAGFGSQTVRIATSSASPAPLAFRHWTRRYQDESLFMDIPPASASTSCWWAGCLCALNGNISA